MAKQDLREDIDKDRPPVRVVRDFHTNSDLDSNQDAQHHTIGIGMNQAASGAHNHDGANSVKLLEGYTLGGSKSGGAALESVIGALVRMGAIDETTA